MTKRLTLTLIVLFASIAAMHAQSRDYLLNIGDFKEFTVYNNLNVIYKFNTDSAGFASFNCTPQVAPAITFTNTKGKIKIEILSDTPITEELPTVTIYSSTLAKATNLGDSTVCLALLNPCEKLSLKVMDNGTIQALDVYTNNITASAEAGCGRIFITGKTQDAKFTVAGAGVIEARSLSAAKGSVWMFGTGSVDCNVENSLSVYGMGSGSLYYSGDPTIKKRNIGVKVIKIDENE